MSTVAAPGRDYPEPALGWLAATRVRFVLTIVALAGVLLRELAPGQGGRREARHAAPKDGLVGGQVVAARHRRAARAAPARGRDRGDGRARKHRSGAARPAPLRPGDKERHALAGALLTGPVCTQPAPEL